MRAIAFKGENPMKRLLASLSVFAFSCCLHAQVVDTTVCEILKDPVSFNGKIVKIKGTVEAGFDQFVIKGADCGKKVNDIWLAYPEGTKAKSGAALVLELQPAKNFSGTAEAAEQRAAVTLDKSKDFKQFDSALSTPYKGDGLCIGCGRYTVTATLVGRLDGAKAGIQIDKKGKITAIAGFGNLNTYSARLVLQSVSDVSTQEIDYSKSAAATKGEVMPENNGSDPLAEGHKTAKVFGDGNPLGAKVERAAAAFGKPGEKNGVDISFGTGNQAIAKDEGKGDSDSPDGVLYNCKMNMDRLKGNALSVAIAYAGTAIADLREPEKAASYAGSYDFEYYAYQTAALGAIGNRLKTLTLPGGYLIWNKGWAPADMESSLESGIKGYLGGEELLKR
jgi:hypothetical protein